MKKIFFVFGTRPEAIKVAPLIKLFEQDKDNFDVKICVTGQHREMLDQVLDFFDIYPDYDLKLMKPNQTLYDITADALKGIGKILKIEKPDLIFVQGDTTTAFTGALAGYYEKIKVAHIEAGLRSGNKYSPYPEEINRILAGHIADFHFAPTKRAADSLKNEGIHNNVYITGNSVIDALKLGLNIIKNDEEKYLLHFDFLDFSKKIILVTGHRRESFGEPFKNMCNAVKHIAENNDVEIIYPVHLNPNVRDVVNDMLKDRNNIHLVEPLSYPYLIWLMNKSYIVLTDSGGIQEEAPALGKPVLVMRDVTERQEGVDAGTAKLVGTDKNIIITETEKLLKNRDYYDTMANAVNPYGDGTTSKQINDLLIKYL